MKQLKQKVIKLGIERGYLPTSNNDSALYKFDTQFLRLQEEVGEASKELRLKNFDKFKMEVGDVLVLQANCNYIVSKYLDIPHTVRFMDMYSDIIENLILKGVVEFSIIPMLNFRRECLQLAYNKIKERGGILIGNDYFKPTDPEYIKYMQENENNI